MSSAVKDVTGFAKPCSLWRMRDPVTTTSSIEESSALEGGALSWAEAAEATKVPQAALNTYTDNGFTRRMIRSPMLVSGCVFQGKNLAISGVSQWDALMRGSN